MTINNPLQHGLPDPAELARWAGQFFPEFPSGSSTIAPVATLAPASIPSERDLAGLIHEIASETPRSPIDVESAPVSFLQDLRAFGSAGLPSAITPSEAPQFISHPGAKIPVFDEPGPALATPSSSAPVPGAGHAARQASFAFQDLRTEPASAAPTWENIGSFSPIVSQVTTTAPTPSGAFDVNTIRRDFPILSEIVDGKPLVWLDNAATTQKPTQVIERLKQFYEHENSNIHRAAHTLAARSTDAYEDAREKTRAFLNAPSTREIVFVRGATEAINLVAQTFGRQQVGAGDEIIVSHLEHHANIVPWQMLAAEKGAKLRVIPVDDKGQLLLGEYAKLLNPRTKLVAVTQVSNALGTVNPVQEITALAHKVGAKVLIDGAQSVSHMSVDVQAIGCDFFVFSGHKVFAPTGIGALYGTPEVLEQIPPWHGGGNMIQDVTFEKTVYHPAPAKFEAGTGNIADAVGLGAAIDYVHRLGMNNIARYEHYLLEYGTEALQRIPGLRLIGTADKKASVLSFVLDGYRTEDIGKALSREGIAVRSGHHCAQPILRRFGLEATVRPSLAFYNTCDEIDHLAAVLWNLRSGHRSLP